MLIKTNELEGAALDWVVAKCEGKQVEMQSGVCHDAELLEMGVDEDTRLIYAADWAQAGPIIEREKIAAWKDQEGGWFASCDEGKGDDSHGSTPLIAAMRCYVASKMGAEVEIPEELCLTSKS